VVFVGHPGAVFGGQHTGCVFDSQQDGANPAGRAAIPGAANLLGTCSNVRLATTGQTFVWTHFGPLRRCIPHKQKTVCRQAFSIGLLNGGAYEYGTSKVAVIYGICWWFFTRNNTGANTCPTDSGTNAAGRTVTDSVQPLSGCWQPNSTF